MGSGRLASTRHGSRNEAKRWVPSLVVLAFLGACDAETSLEPTPEVIRGSVCPRPHEEPGRISTGPWGTVTPISNGVEYQVNEGYTVTICAKGGSLGDGYNTVTVTGPQSGTLSTPENAGGNIPELVALFGNRHHRRWYYQSRPSSSSSSTLVYHYNDRMSRPPPLTRPPPHRG